MLIESPLDLRLSKNCLTKRVLLVPLIFHIMRQSVGANKLWRFFSSVTLNISLSQYELFNEPFIIPTSSIVHEASCPLWANGRTFTIICRFEALGFTFHPTGLRTDDCCDQFSHWLFVFAAKVWPELKSSSWIHRICIYLKWPRRDFIFAWFLISGEHENMKICRSVAGIWSRDDSPPVGWDHLHLRSCDTSDSHDNWGGGSVTHMEVWLCPRFQFFW